MIANSISFTDAVDSAEARGLSGEVLDIAAYSKNTTIDVKGLYVGSGVNVGDIVSVGSKNYLVTNSSKSESNSAFQEGSIQAKSADSATLHALDGTTASAVTTP